MTLFLKVIARAAAFAAIGLGTLASAHAQGTRAPRFEWSGAIGSFSGEDNPGRLNGQRSEYAGVAGFGWRPSPNVVLEAEIPFYGQKYDTPSTLTPAPFTTIDSRARVDTAGLAVGAKFVVPVQRIELFGGGGVGYYRSRFQATGRVLGFSAEYDEWDASVAPHVKAGFDVLIARGISVGFEYRKLWLTADFGSQAGGKVDIGGDFYFLTVRGRF